MEGRANYERLRKSRSSSVHNYYRNKSLQRVKTVVLFLVLPGN